MDVTCLLLSLVMAGLDAGPTTPLLPLNSVQGVTLAYPGRDRTLPQVVTGEGNTTDGDGALRLDATSGDNEGNEYFGLRIALPEPLDLRAHRLVFDARTDHPEHTRAFYVRLYNQGEAKPAWSFNSWGGLLKREWRTFNFQPGLSAEGLAWEAEVVEDRVATRIDRVEIIIGTAGNGVPVSLLVDNLRTGAPVQSLKDLDRVKPLVRDTPLVAGGQPQAVVLHPDSDAGRAAAAAVVAAVKAQTGATLEARPATVDDRLVGQTAILLGNSNTNPALMVPYARYQTPVDVLCPGAGGTLVHTVHDPYGQGFNLVVVGASDDAGLAKAAEVFAGVVAAQPKGDALTLPRLFERGYGESFLKRVGYAAQTEAAANRVEQGLAAGRKSLAEGRHTSIAGDLEGVARRYQLTGHAAEARLFVALWDLYAESAVADPRKYGGPWGFDSDFPSMQVVFGWDVIEEDPSLTDEERLRVTKAMARWLQEAVLPKVGTSDTRVPHNHQTFPGLGAMAAGIYFTQGYDVLEGQRWLDQADALFQNQASRFKPHEDCNGYQWLTNGHQLRYAVARPYLGMVEHGSAKRIADYAIGTMNNLGYQVPYGDTGSWQCWNSEMLVLDTVAYLTGDAEARWAANLKRRVKNTFDLYGFYQPGDDPVPQRYNGVQVWPLEPLYHQVEGAEPKPPLDVAFDKITFRGAMDPAAEYLLLDGLSNGGHKHLDGNSLPQLTQFGRIWLADNDYFKAQVKYHNSLLAFKDGQSTPIPEYAELLGAGETERYGFSRTRMSGYSGLDWDRTVVWLKQLGAFVVLDRLVAREADDYQLRLLWHGVGEPALSDQGLLLTQKGPSMWIQPAPGPKLRLIDDVDLGANWAGYPHAAPVVRSMSAVATVKLGEGDSYLYGTALHGAADGQAAPWKLTRLAGAEGYRIDTGQGPIRIVLGPYTAGGAASDAQVLVLDGQGLTELKAQPAAGGAAMADALAKLEAAEPPANLTAAADAPAFTTAWEQRPQPERLLVSGNHGTAGSLNLGRKLTSEPGPAAANVFSGATQNLDALFDGTWGSTGDSVMYEPDKTVVLTVDLGAPVQLSRVRWQQWWATTSSKNIPFLIGKATLTASSDAFAADTRLLGEVTDAGPHPNFGSPVEYAVDGGGATARYVRLTIEPQPGSAVYLGEILVEGKPVGEAAEAAPFHITRVIGAKLAGADQPAALVATTVEGELLALNADGAPRWQVTFPGQLNDVAAADLNRDGRDELIVARQDRKVTVLDADGQELWSRDLDFYRNPPYANVALAGDIDGDGTPEVVVGAQNWRFYAWRADGTPLWHYESVHPSRSGAVSDLDGDGQAEVICGTHYYQASVLNADGTRKWAYSFGPICYDVATGSFDGNQTRGVVFGGGDGILHYVDSAGKARLKYNTGDEVREVETADLDGDGRDEVIGGSMNYNLYAFAADGTRRWRHDLGNEITALVTVPAGNGAVAVAGTSGGEVVAVDAGGTIVARTSLGSPVVQMAPHGAGVVVATADGRLRELRAGR